MIFVPRLTSQWTNSVSFCTVKDPPAVDIDLQHHDVLLDVLVLLVSGDSILLVEVIVDSGRVVGRAVGVPLLLLSSSMLLRLKLMILTYYEVFSFSSHILRFFPLSAKCCCFLRSFPFVISISSILCEFIDVIFPHFTRSASASLLVRIVGMSLGFHCAPLLDHLSCQPLQLSQRVAIYVFNPVFILVFNMGRVFIGITCN